MQYMYNWVILSSLFAPYKLIALLIGYKINKYYLNRKINKISYNSVIIDVNQRKQSAI